MFTAVFEWFWVESPPGSCSLPAYRLFGFCPGAYPPALPLCESTVGLLPPSGVTGQPAPFSARLFLRSPWSSAPSASFVELLFQTDALLLSVLQSNSGLGQQSQGSDTSCGRESSFFCLPCWSFSSRSCLTSSSKFLSQLLQLLWVTEFLPRSTDFPFLGLEPLKRNSCSWTSSSCVYKSAQKCSTLSRCFRKTRELVLKRICDFIPFIDHLLGLLEMIFWEFLYAAHSRAVSSTAWWIFPAAALVLFRISFILELLSFLHYLFMLSVM